MSQPEQELSKKDKLKKHLVVEMPSRFTEGSPTWGLDYNQFKSIIRIMAGIAGLGLLWLTLNFHADFFGTWTGIKWGGWILGFAVTATQLALVHRGWKDPILLIGGIGSYIYDIAAVCVGLMLATEGQAPIFGDWLFIMVGVLVSILGEALVEYGLLKSFWMEG